MFTLNQKSKDSISNDVGLPFEEIKKKTLFELEEHIEKRIGKKLKFPKTSYLI